MMVIDDGDDGDDDVDVDDDDDDDIAVVGGSLVGLKYSPGPPVYN